MRRALVTLVLAGVLFWRTESVVWAPVPILLVNFLYYEVIILRAARREMGFPIFKSLMRSVPGPLFATIILSLPLLYFRGSVNSLSLWGLAGLGAFCGVVYGPLTLGLILEKDERRRVMQIIGDILKSSKSQRE